jgi:hypothetical protein
MARLRVVLALVCAAAPGARADDGGAPILNGTPYRGVTPGGSALPPRPPRLPVHGPQRLTWPGFQVRAGVPTVFLELTGQPDYEVAAQPGGLVVTLKHTVVPVRNNRRPLDVAYFDTQVSEVVARQHGERVLVTIRVKGRGRPTHREHVESAAGGYQLLVVELPPEGGGGG